MSAPAGAWSGSSHSRAEAREALLAAGATLIPVPVDQEGIDVKAGRQLCPTARLAIITPSHQFPTGVTMSLSRRLALLEWARAAQSWIVEDDYDIVSIALANAPWRHCKDWITPGA